jgi:hypothetical protein
MSASLSDQNISSVAPASRVRSGALLSPAAALLQGRPLASWFLDDAPRGEQLLPYAEQDFHLSDQGKLRVWSAAARDEVARWEVTGAIRRAFLGFTLRYPYGSVPASPLLVVGPHDEDEEEGGSEKQNSSCAHGPISSYRS